MTVRCTEVPEPPERNESVASYLRRHREPSWPELYRCCLSELAQVEGILACALGLPTEAVTGCAGPHHHHVGDHSAVTLAEQAATRIRHLTETTEEASRPEGET